MKPTLLSKILILISMILTGLLFVPFYHYYYYLPGHDLADNEIVTKFDRWYSPFRFFILEAGGPQMIILFVGVAIVLLLTIALGIIYNINKKDRMVANQIVSFILLIIAYLFMIFFMIVFAPQM